MKTPRGLRNNNPLNIRLAPDNPWQGEVRPSQDKSFCQFRTMAYGYRAAMKLLRNYRERYGLNTIRGIIGRWAPPEENDTEAYIEAVCRYSGIDANRRLNLHEKRTLTALVAAMSRVENGRPADMAQVEAGWRLLINH